MQSIMCNTYILICTLRLNYLVSFGNLRALLLAESIWQSVQGPLLVFSLSVKHYRAIKWKLF